MAQDEAPELTKLDGCPVYRVNIIKFKNYEGQRGICSFCPRNKSKVGSYVENARACNSPCGVQNVFVREDAWHKMRLQGS